MVLDYRQVKKKTSLEQQNKGCLNIANKHYLFYFFLNTRPFFFENTAFFLKTKQNKLIMASTFALPHENAVSWNTGQEQNIISSSLPILPLQTPFLSKHHWVLCDVQWFLFCLIMIWLVHQFLLYVTKLVAPPRTVKVYLQPQ